MLKFQIKAFRASISQGALSIMNLGLLSQYFNTYLIKDFVVG